METIHEKSDGGTPARPLRGTPASNERQRLSGGLCNSHTTAALNLQQTFAAFPHSAGVSFSRPPYRPANSLPPSAPPAPLSSTIAVQTVPVPPRAHQPQSHQTAQQTAVNPSQKKEELVAPRTQQQRQKPQTQTTQVQNYAHQPLPSPPYSVLSVQHPQRVPQRPHPVPAAPPPWHAAPSAPFAPYPFPLHPFSAYTYANAPPRAHPPHFPPMHPYPGFPMPAAHFQAPPPAQRTAGVPQGPVSQPVQPAAPSPSDVAEASKTGGAGHGCSQGISLTKRPEVFPSVITDKYEVGETLCEGSFGVVVRLREKTPNAKGEHQTRAMKLIAKTPYAERGIGRQPRLEVLCHSACGSGSGHPFVVRFLEAFEDDETLFVVTEFADRGDLLELLAGVAACGHGLPELFAAHLFAQAAEAVKRVHACGWVHRDVKPENFCLSSAPPQGSPSSQAVSGECEKGPGSPCWGAILGGSRPPILKLCDFGWCCMRSETSAQKCGTYEHFSPEQAGETAQDDRVDIWSLGVVLFEMLTGSNPTFPLDPSTDSEKRARRVLEWIKVPDWPFCVIDSLAYARPAASLWRDPVGSAWALAECKAWCDDRAMRGFACVGGYVEGVSALRGPARDLLGRMLQADPRRRPTIDEVLEHPFVRPHRVPSLRSLPPAFHGKWRTPSMSRTATGTAAATATAASQQRPSRSTEAAHTITQNRPPQTQGPVRVLQEAPTAVSSILARSAAASAPETATAASAVSASALVQPESREGGELPPPGSAATLTGSPTNPLEGAPQQPPAGNPIIERNSIAASSSAAEPSMQKDKSPQKDGMVFPSEATVTASSHLDPSVPAPLSPPISPSRRMQSVRGALEEAQATAETVRRETGNGSPSSPIIAAMPAEEAEGSAEAAGAAPSPPRAGARRSRAAAGVYGSRGEREGGSPSSVSSTHCWECKLSPPGGRVGGASSAVCPAPSGTPGAASVGAVSSSGGVEAEGDKERERETNSNQLGG
uniref:Protein kinase domain-containing protein n=1 Tax=Chromera velia CCMP2878 TaxID=1169474 RepID=A0A0G4FIH5_9ALVE|eukprot:Cvel_17154.t1-p1 / transcript=Cvel_17154.t1 / gene=Cvel_17154 / organism=Chromera_velia_CCMP2878 / gene_product=Aurora kinase B, putative / transcript_product=Aurora kinase B, putative / location=Cvel_scaffold1355:33095-38506(+) / protein_length=993 / sequence_SO=supercontig / SO=protein_coding / is_pseudo=false